MNKDFKKMLIENAEFRALSLREILPSSDGTRKVCIVSYILASAVIIIQFSLLLVSLCALFFPLVLWVCAHKDSSD